MTLSPKNGRGSWREAAEDEAAARGRRVEELKAERLAGWRAWLRDLAMWVPDQYPLAVAQAVFALRRSTDQRDRRLNPAPSRDDVLAWLERRGLDRASLDREEDVGAPPAA